MSHSQSVAIPNRGTHDFHVGLSINDGGDTLAQNPIIFN